MRSEEYAAWPPGRPGLVIPARLDPAGRCGPTRVEARRGWRRVSKGFYVPESVDPDDVDQRIVEAMTSLRPGEAITGWAALRWQGGYWFGGVDADVPAVVHTYQWPRLGVRFTQEGIDPREVHDVAGVPCTVPVRSVVYAMRVARDVRAAVAALDMACYSDLVSVSEVAAYLDCELPRTGVPEARAALTLADENAWSPQETRMRLIWELDAELPRPLCNQPVFDLEGQHLATPDLLDVEAGVVGEYDGAAHLTPARRRLDERRAEVYRAVGLELVVMLAGDGRDEVAARLAAAYALARRRRTHREWTVAQPSWWRPTATVEQRRAIHPAEHARLLGYRRTVI